MSGLAGLIAGAKVLVAAIPLVWSVTLLITNALGETRVCGPEEELCTESVVGAVGFVSASVVPVLLALAILVPMVRLTRGSRRIFTAGYVSVLAVVDVVLMLWLGFAGGTDLTELLIVGGRTATLVTLAVITAGQGALALLAWWRTRT